MRKNGSLTRAIYRLVTVQRRAGVALLRTHCAFRFFGFRVCLSCRADSRRDSHIASVAPGLVICNLIQATAQATPIMQTICADLDYRIGSFCTCVGIRCYYSTSTNRYHFPITTVTIREEIVQIMVHAVHMKPGLPVYLES